MTKFKAKTTTCPLCGHEIEQIVVVSSIQLGSPDLDLRPASMIRETMSKWVTECDKCGFVFSTHKSDLSQEKKALYTEITKSNDYKECKGITLQDDLAKRFYRAYMISMAEKEYENAFFFMLYAAWACDDANDTHGASDCRKAALKIYKAHKKSFKRNKTDMQLIKADLLRRSGQYDDAIQYLKKKLFFDNTKEAIKKFQIEKSKDGDPGWYTIQDAVNYCNAESEKDREEAEKYLKKTEKDDFFAEEYKERRIKNPLRGYMRNRKKSN